MPSMQPCALPSPAEKSERGYRYIERSMFRRSYQRNLARNLQPGFHIGATPSRSRVRTRAETRAANAPRDTRATLTIMVKQFSSSAYAPVEDALEAYKLARVAFVNSVNELLKDGNPGVDAALMEKDVLSLLYRPLVQGAR